MIFLEAATGGVLRNFAKNSQENTCARVSYRRLNDIICLLVHYTLNNQMHSS